MLGCTKREKRVDVVYDGHYLLHYLKFTPRGVAEVKQASMQNLWSIGGLARSTWARTWGLGWTFEVYLNLNLESAPWKLYKFAAQNYFLVMFDLTSKVGTRIPVLYLDTQPNSDQAFISRTPG